MAIILHVDMDAFFASVEQLHHPAWRGRPVVVGSGPHERGVVSTCSYEARRYGIHSAMPSRTAYELCPHAIFTPPDMALYKAVSDRAFEVFSHYSPYVEAVSIDEAFLDITGTVHLHGSPRALGEALRAEVKRTCGVTCSVGIAPNRLLAKIGSEERKPDGLTLLPVEPAAIAAFLAPKPLQTIWGVGRKTVALLRRHGLVTCGDVQRLDPRTLATILKSPVLATALYEHAFGRASDVVAREDADEKSVSREHTFGEDVADRAAVETWMDACHACAPLERVFSNAGVGTGIEDEANVRATFAINVGGNLNVVLKALALFRQPDARRAADGVRQIVLTASIAGYGPLKSCPAYAATKSCLKTWGLSLRGMLAPEGIRVSVVCPGFVRSRITDRNTCPMPFFMEADRAARIILARTDRNTGLIAFPWPMRLATWLLASLPFRVNEWINRLLPDKIAPRRD